MVTVNSGVVITRYPRKKASTAFTVGAMVVTGTTYVQPVTSTSASVYGSIQRAVVSTDDDYALNSRVPVTVAHSRISFRMTVTGTFAATSEGALFDASDSVTVNADASTYDLFYCEKYISSTEGIFTVYKPER